MVETPAPGAGGEPADARYKGMQRTLNKVFDAVGAKNEDEYFAKVKELSGSPKPKPAPAAEVDPDKDDPFPLNTDAQYYDEAGTFKEPDYRKAVAGWNRNQQTRASLSMRRESENAAIDAAIETLPESLKSESDLARTLIREAARNGGKDPVGEKAVQAAVAKVKGMIEAAAAEHVVRVDADAAARRAAEGRPAPRGEGTPATQTKTVTDGTEGIAEQGLELLKRKYPNGYPTR